MPALTRWYLKAALLYFVAALLLAIALAAQHVVALPEWLGALSPVFFHLFMVGWVTQLIFGVAYWMFPKHTREQPHGDERVAHGAFFLLNAGLLLRVVGEPLNSISSAPAWGWVLVVSAVLQWLAGLGFVAVTWRRVREK
ncbi:MAG: hypothetical protein ACE5FI_12915 [Anaerolineales bacterium]